jgi:hypothetical protein
MFRPALITLSLALLLQGTQAQMQTHGVPASITSPGTDGNSHGTPASILSPTPVTNRNSRIFINSSNRVRFGNPRLRRPHREFIPVPLFYPVYDLQDPTVSQADPPVANELYSPSNSEDASTAPDDAVREAYLRGAHDALARQQQKDDRYGDHYLDSRENARSSGTQSSANDKQKKSTRKDDTDDETVADETAAAPAPVEDTPPTIFIFKDGHKLQTQNFAIVGQTLVDFSSKAPKKIKFTDLDLDATRKANDDLGIDLRLP